MRVDDVFKVLRDLGFCRFPETQGLFRARCGAIICVIGDAGGQFDVLAYREHPVADRPGDFSVVCEELDHYGGLRAILAQALRRKAQEAARAMRLHGARRGQNQRPDRATKKSLRIRCGSRVPG